MTKTPPAPEKKLFEITSRAIKLRDSAVEGGSSTIETVWQMSGGAITKGVYVGAPGRWVLKASGAAVKAEMSAQLDAIESRLLAERAP